MLTWGKIWYLMLRLWKWRTTLNWEMLSSPDTLRGLPNRFVSMVFEHVIDSLTDFSGKLFKVISWTFVLGTCLKPLQRDIIIIIITLRHQHGYPCLSLTIPPYRPLLPAGLQDYIPYLHRAPVCRFELVILPLLVLVKGPTGVHHLWARPTSPAVSCKSGLSNFDSFHDGC